MLRVTIEENGEPNAILVAAGPNFLIYFPGRPDPIGILRLTDEWEVYSLEDLDTYESCGLNPIVLAAEWAKAKRGTPQRA